MNDHQKNETRGVAGVATDLIRESFLSFIADDALSRGASIAFYVVTSIVPVLVIIVAIAGAVYGREAAQGAIAAELSGVMGREGADLLQAAIHDASGKSAGVVASALGVITLLITSSGVFGEMQSALNVIWKASPKGGTVKRLLRARAASLALVAALGFMLLLSLSITAALAVPDAYIDAHFPFGRQVLSIVNLAVGFLLDATLFAAIYKILPDTDIEWHDVFVGAIATAFLFGIGKFLIGLYLQSTAVASTYGAAGGLIALLLWIYYSAQMFLLGAEFTKAYASYKGSQRGRLDATDHTLR
ncbi:MAG: YihY/virulence factor BrkB family protein [Acetobacteraceae bacterium]|jgi:membrane protein